MQLTQLGLFLSPAGFLKVCETICGLVFNNQ